jgi:Bacterial protein of unknown function (DUF922)
MGNYQLKKIIALVFFIGCFQYIFCQDVIINGVNKNRLLTWDDFSGTPDENSPYEANTYWKLKSSFGSMSVSGDTIKLNTFSVGIVLDTTKTWIKKGKATAALLKHEQGHFNIGLLCQHELIDQMRKTVFLTSNIQQKMQQMFTDATYKYEAMGEQYDKETDHSKNQEAQKKWDEFFAATFSKLNINF